MEQKRALVNCKDRPLEPQRVLLAGWMQNVNRCKQIGELPAFLLHLNFDPRSTLTRSCQCINGACKCTVAAWFWYIIMHRMRSLVFLNLLFYAALADSPKFRSFSWQIASNMKQTVDPKTQAAKVTARFGLFLFLYSSSGGCLFMCLPLAYCQLLSASSTDCTRAQDCCHMC